MSLLMKIRGLWRFDGDEEPVKVSRRTFVFMGACTAAGVALPTFRLAGNPGDIKLALFTGQETLSGYQIMRKTGVARLVSNGAGGVAVDFQGWTFSPTAWEEFETYARDIQ